MKIFSIIYFLSYLSDYVINAYYQIVLLSRAFKFSYPQILYNK